MTQGSFQHIATLCGLLLLTPGILAAEVQTLYSVPDSPAAVISCNHGRLYIAEVERQALVCRNLSDGTEIAAFPLALRPTCVAVTPNEHRLFVGESATTDTGYPLELPGKILEFDLLQNVVAREFDFAFGIGGMVATDAGLLAITSPNTATYGPEVRLLDSLTGRTSSRLVCTSFGLSLDPSQTSLFGYGISDRFWPVVRAFFDKATVEFTTLRKASEDMSQPPFPSPDAQLLLSGNAAYRGSTNAAEDMKLLKIIQQQMGGFCDAAFDGGPTFVLANSAGLDFYRRDTLEQFSHADSGNTLSTRYCGDWVYAIVILPNNTRSVVRVPNPALGIERNQPPIPEFTWLPPVPTTRELLVLDGRSTTDDETTPAQLQYRWDFDNDGVFETVLSTNSFATCRLRQAGPHVITLETRDRFGATSRVQHTITSTLETYVGGPGTNTVAWELPFSTHGVAFDPVRPFLYALDREGSKVVLLNLTNGLIEHEWVLFTPPSALAVQPDGSRLYASQTSDGQSRGWIAEFDLEKRILTAEFPTSMAVFGLLATDGGFVLAEGQATSNSDLHVYRASTGERLGPVRVLDQPSCLAFHPAQNAVYTGGPDPSTVQGYPFNPVNGALGYPQVSTNRSGGQVFALPDGANLITGAGLVIDSVHLDLVASLGITPVAMVPIPERGLVGLLAGGRIQYVRTGSWSSFLTLRTSEYTAYLGKHADRVYEVALDHATTRISSRMIPAVSEEHNLIPTVELTSPTNGCVVLPGTPLNLVAEVSDLDGSIQSVDFYAGTELLAQRTNDPYMLTWVPNIPGVYELRAVARDNLGATNTSVAVELIVNAPPTVNLHDPAPQGPLLSPASFTLEADAADQDGKITKVDFYYKPDGAQPWLIGTSTNQPFRLAVQNLIGIGGSVGATAFDNRGASATAWRPLALLGLPGDDFYRPLMIEGQTAVGHANNMQATTQRYESLGISNTMWWSWTAPDLAIVTLSTKGSTFDTLLQVFTGTNLAQARIVTDNDDDSINPPTSRAKFLASPGANYRICVGSPVPGDVGEILLNLETRQVPSRGFFPAPTNDLFANRSLLAGTNFSVAGTNLGATNEPSEPRHLWPMLASRSVWWSWVAPVDGRVTLSTEGSDFDTILAVYTGTWGALRSAGSNDDKSDGDPTSEISFDAKQGTNYSFAVDGFEGDSGIIHLNLQMQPPSPPVPHPIPPANDNLADASLLAGDLVLASGYNNGATTEPGESPRAGIAPTHSVWWEWTAARSGPVYLRVRGPQPPAPQVAFVVAVYTDFVPPALSEVAAARQVTHADGRPVTVVRFEATANRTYYVAVDSKYATMGDIDLLLTTRLQPPGLSLQLLRLQVDGTTRLEVEPPYDCVVRILCSSNLVDWVPFVSISVSNRFEFVMPRSMNSHQFLRAITDR